LPTLDQRENKHIYETIHKNKNLSYEEHSSYKNEKKKKKTKKIKKIPKKFNYKEMQFTIQQKLNTK
jgi:hypothetical protein